MYHITISLESARLAQEVIQDRRDLRSSVVWTASNALDIADEVIFEELSAELNECGIVFDSVEVPE